MKDLLDFIERHWAYIEDHAFGLVILLLLIVPLISGAIADIVRAFRGQR